MSRYFSIFCWACLARTLLFSMRFFSLFLCFASALPFLSLFFAFSSPFLCVVFAFFAFSFYFLSLLFPLQSLLFFIYFLDITLFFNLSLCLSFTSPSFCRHVLLSSSHLACLLASSTPLLDPSLQLNSSFTY